MNKALFCITFLIVYSLQGFGQQHKIVFEFTADSPESVSIEPAILKYDKDFAWSFAFDDGYRSAFTIALPLLSGGYSEYYNKSFPGFFYSDGCGQLIPFNASISLSSKNNGEDVHLPSSTHYIRWSEVNALINDHWAVQNHSYDLSNVENVDFGNEIELNFNHVKNKTAYRMFSMVPPNGISDYIQPAFDTGVLAVFTSSASYSLSGSKALQVDNPLASAKPVFWRSLLNSELDNLDIFIRRADSIIGETTPTNHIWWNEFTHRVQDEVYAASVTFSDLKGYLEYLENLYGASGADNGWFANGTEVFEYLHVRDQISVTRTVSGSKIRIEVDYSQVNPNIANFDLSLIITGEDVKNIQSMDQYSTLRSCQKSTNKYLVNIDLPDGVFSSVHPTEWPRQKLAVYPNPIDSHIHIHNLPVGSHHYQVMLASIHGEIIYQQAFIASHDIELNLEKTYLPDGLYIITVINEDSGQVYSRKLIKQ